MKSTGITTKSRKKISIMLVRMSAQKRCRHPSYAFTQVASEWKPAKNLRSVCLHLSGIDINH